MGKALVTSHRQATVGAQQTQPGRLSQLGGSWLPESFCVWAQVENPGSPRLQARSPPPHPPAQGPYASLWGWDRKSNFSQGKRLQRHYLLVNGFVAAHGVDHFCLKQKWVLAATYIVLTAKDCCLPFSQDLVYRQNNLPPPRLYPRCPQTQIHPGST